MSHNLKLQLLFYDRPKEMHYVRSKLQSDIDLESFINNHYKNLKTRSLLLHRFNSIDQIIYESKQSNIEWLEIQDENYPPYFHQLVDPPLAIFYKGDIGILSDRTLGIVGTRCPSLLANQRMKLMVKMIKGFVIVSGGALGIDTFAHQLAISHKLPTISVLACGLDQLYPKSNQSLFTNILNHYGCLISEYPVGVQPKPCFFPQRNRLIAALSSKLIVIEAALKSGAVITANLASDMGIDVAAMVGSFNAPESVGCYALINDGATAIGSISDFCEFINLFYDVVDSNQNDYGVEHLILSKISSEPIHLEDLANHCRLSVNEIIEYITTLSLNDKVRLSSGHMVSKHEF